MLLGWLRPLYTADSGASGGAAADPSAETKKTDTQEHMIPKSRFDEVNTELAQLREWKTKQEQADAAAAKERQKQADAAAAQRGEFEKLASERQARITALESEQATDQEQLTAYRDEMERQIKARLKALPEEIRAMAPEGDTLARFAWLEKAEAAAQKLGGGRPAGGAPDINAGARSASTRQTPDDVQAANRARLAQRSGRY